MYENLMIGLVSGLVVSFIVLVLSKFWNRVVEPWFEERVYKDLHVEGKWFSLYVEADDYRQEIINLKRHGHAIAGTMTCKTGADEGEEYSLCGSFRNLLLPLTYEATDKNKSDRGTITLKSCHNGQRLIGEVAFYATIHDSVGTTKVIWFRKKEELDNTVKYIKEHRDELKELRERDQKIREEFSEFMEEFTKEFAKRRREKEEEKEKAIEGEVIKIEHKED